MVTGSLKYHLNQQIHCLLKSEGREYLNDPIGASKPMSHKAEISSIKMSLPKVTFISTPFTIIYSQIKISM